MKKLNSKQGFSLVELLVVMAIVAVLLSIAVYGLMIAQRNSRNSQRSRVMNEMKIAIENYYLANGRYPVNYHIEFSSGNGAWIVCMEDDCNNYKTIKAEERYLLPYSMQSGEKPISSEASTIYCYKPMESGDPEQGRYKLGYGNEGAEDFVNIGTTVNDKCTWPPVIDEKIPGSGSANPFGGEGAPLIVETELGGEGETESK